MNKAFNQCKGFTINKEKKHSEKLQQPEDCNDGELKIH